jgi:dephospho-CoA kinase
MKDKTLLIGITGGIGSGKTLACRYFESLGYKVIYADIIARQLYQSSLKKRLVKEFGSGILDEKGNVSGPNSRKIIFSNRKNIARVNKIVHPFVIKEIDKIIRRTKRKIILIETAIMFESGYYKKVDFTVLIYSIKKNRIRRVQKRDKMPLKDIKGLMSMQMEENKKLQMADFVIKNDSTIKNFKKNLKRFAEILKMLQ